jgi:ABC-2 type transport system ATP-binding protein
VSSAAAAATAGQNAVVIACEGVRKVYGATVAVDDVGLVVPAGAVLGLVGPNGAGKSTLMSLIAGLIEPTRGRISVCAVDVASEARAVQRKLAFLPDFFGLYDDLSVSEYLEYFARAYDIRADLREARVRAAAAATSVDNRLAENVGALSRGLRQRVAVARCLLHDPPLLLLDEPAAGLDPEARFELHGLLMRLAAAGKTLVVSSHILSELEDFCTHVAMMHRGKLLAHGPLKEVQAKLTGKRRFRVAAASGMPRGQLVTELTRLASVQEPAGVGEDAAVFTCTGDEAAVAKVLADLVRAGVPVTSFAPEGTIQDAYLALLRGTME